MSTTLSREFPVARKGHRCDSCTGYITQGERYHRWKGTGDWSGVATLKECADCFQRYGRYQYLNPENRAKADAWLRSLPLEHPAEEGAPDA